MKVSAQFSLLNSIINTLAKPKATFLEQNGVPVILLDHGNRRYKISNDGITYEAKSRKTTTARPLTRQETNSILRMVTHCIDRHKDLFPNLHEIAERNTRLSQLKKTIR